MDLERRAWRRASIGSSFHMTKHSKYGNRTAQEINFPWFMRIIFIVPGAIAVVSGWAARMQGILWFKGFSMRYGQKTISSTLGWIVFGAMSVLIGIFPWNW